MTRWCLDLILPKYCLGCGKENFSLCPDCFCSLPISNGIVCFVCGRRFPFGQICQDCHRKHQSLLSGILVASDWDNPLLREIIYGYKYQFIKELADPLSQLMINFLQTEKRINWSTDKLILLPVPLHGRRLAWRGFNQAEILAEKIGKHFNISYDNKILIRRRYALPQKEIPDQKDRKNNIKNAFALRSDFGLPLKSDFGNAIKNKIIILVDDVSTTGSTLEDCARAIKLLSPKEIWGLVIARG